MIEDKAFYERVGEIRELIRNKELRFLTKDQKNRLVEQEILLQLKDIPLDLQKTVDAIPRLIGAPAVSPFYDTKVFVSMDSMLYTADDKLKNFEPRTY